MSGPQDRIRATGPAFADRAGGTWTRPPAPPCLPRSAWAWEFLRRNTNFAAALDRAHQALREEEPIGQIRVFSARDLDGIGGSPCLYASSIADDGYVADVLWHPDVCASVLRGLATSAPVGSCAPLRLGDLPLKGVLIRTDSFQHLLVRDGSGALQLCVRGADLRRPVQILPQPGPSVPRSAQLRAWSTYMELERGFTLSPLKPAQPSLAGRLLQVLIALDGWRAGVAQRQIAIALFGPARVAREWRDPHDCLRDNVRRAIARGRELSERGYVRMLATQRP